MANKLKNPIKEIVLSVSFEQNIDIAQLESISNNKQLLSDFSTCKPGFDAKVSLGEEPSSEFSHTGYIFKSDKMEYSSILNIKNIILDKKNIILDYIFLSRCLQFIKNKIY